MDNTPQKNSTNSLHPIFSFERLDGYKFSIEECNQKEKLNLILTIVRLSKMTWSEIQTTHRHGMGSEIINRDSIKETIPKEIAQDVRFLALRFSGKKPMVGYRCGQIFYLLWLDSKFKLYGH